MMNPQRFGPYIIQRKLGAGGMGDVFAATHDQTGEPAAIKVLASHLARQPGFRGRFEVEIETLRRLDHPAIVRILGFGEQDGTLYYAMELVDGHSLESAIEDKRKLPWRQVIDIAQQLCKALKHAHDRGIIHRDIKPANIMMLSSGQVKLADFGIAQLYGVSGLTLDGGIVGTASYLSPEQADGAKATARSDLYSLGATLYALLTGRPPFVGHSLPELLRLQRSAVAPPPSQLCADVPRELDAVILGLLAKGPQERIGSAVTLAKALQAVQDAIGLQTRVGLSADESAADHAPPTDAQTTQASAMDQTIARAAPGTSPARDVSVHDATMASIAPPVRAAEPASAPPADMQATQASIPGKSVDLTPAVAVDASSPENESSPATVFLTAEQAAQMDQQRQLESQAPQPREIPLGTILLVTLAIILAAGIYWLLRPPTADALYHRITQAAASGDAQALLNVSGDLDEFRQLYPGDPRLAELREIEHRLSQVRSQRLQPIVERHFNTGQDQLPLAQLRDQALRLAATSPAEAMGQLDAILALAGDEASWSEEDRPILLDARQQRERMQVLANQQQVGHLLLIRQRLARARELAATDATQSRAMAAAIVRLYADKPWAAELVGQAKQLAGAPDTSSP